MTEEIRPPAPAVAPPQRSPDGRYWWNGVDWVPFTPPGPQLPNRTSWLAFTSLVLGIVWLGGIGSLLAVLVGWIGLRRIKSSAGELGGRKLAIAGLVLGWVGVVVTPLATASTVFVRQRQAGIQQDLRRAAIAQEIYREDPNSGRYTTSLSDLVAAGFRAREGVTLAVMSATAGARP